MKVMKIALLATAAVAAVSASARAEDLGALKAQIEALNNRISQIEAAPSVPTGYQLMTISEAPAIVAPTMDLGKGYLPTATNFGIQATADVPATTNVQWSGRVRAKLRWDNVDDVTAPYDSDVEVLTDTELKLTATTDTAVGEVGVFAKWVAEARGHTLTNATNGDDIREYYGWWKMTPEMSLIGGFTGSLGGIGHGNDAFTGHVVGAVGAVGGTDDSSQFRLAYASGPISAAIALEGHDHNDQDRDYAVAAEVKWAGDTVSGELAGFILEDGAGVSDWQIGAGLTFGLDIITLSAAAAFGEDSTVSYMKGSVLAKANLSESVRLELGAGIVNPDGGGNNTVGVNGGVYWAPVSQLTIGAEASWKKTEPATDGTITAGLVTVFSF